MGRLARAPPNVLVNRWASPPGRCSGEQTVIWASSSADAQTGVRTTSLTAAYECLPVPIRDPFQTFSALFRNLPRLLLAVHHKAATLNYLNS
jgi:hypothetical protein